MNGAYIHLHFPQYFRVLSLAGFSGKRICALRTGEIRRLFVKNLQDVVCFGTRDVWLTCVPNGSCKMDF